ncbi:MAG TPA: serine hydrolase domain-containing protein [Aggregatilineales bacterium]|nr:serine hydrolase domain-containing protein [Aggregatilineales bacterium]
MLEAVREHLQTEAAQLCNSGYVPGYLAGVYHAGEQTVVAAGLANVATSIPMTEDTGYLMGSITKVFTATLVLQCVERGQIDLDERVTRYLPEFTLVPPANAQDIRVRNLLNHTNGIDGDFFWPDEVKGRDALKYYLAQLGAHCGTLFEPGEYASYSNAGMLVAGRLIEVVTGQSYHDLLEREIYRCVGMDASSTSAEQAILRRTAVGHFFDPATKAIRRTEMFMLPETWSACGSTPIVTIADLLAFARTHLADGVAPSGERVLSAELTRQMRTKTFDMGTPNISVMGLGWPFLAFGETPVFYHGGASPGGAAALIIVPEHDFAFAAFGNAGGAAALTDRLAQWLLRDYLGLAAPSVVSSVIEVSDLSAYEGTYRSNQLRVDVKAIDGQLEETMTFEPLDAAQARIYNRFTGGQVQAPPRRLVPVGEGLFAPAGAPLEMFNGLGRVALVSFHGRTNSRVTHRSFGGRMNRRQLDSA